MQNFKRKEILTMTIIYSTNAGSTERYAKMLSENPQVQAAFSRVDKKEITMEKIKCGMNSINGLNMISIIL